MRGVEDGRPILEQLEEACIVSIEPYKEGTFVIMEKCDNYFSMELTSKQLELLALEILEIAKWSGK